MEVASCLPEDVVLEMFSRLPKKSRLRCEAVSKNWQNLIEKSSSFRARAVDSGFVQVFCDDDLTKQVDFYRLDDKGSLHLQDSLVIDLPKEYLGSYNGFSFFLRKETPQAYFELYNPVTRHITTLPQLPLSTLKFHLGIGFAPDPETNSYKFFLSYVRPWHVVGVAIFNSVSKKWKTKEPIRAPFRPIPWLGNATLYSRRTLYWLPEYSSNSPNSPNLYAFCMKTMTFRFLELPMAGQMYCGRVYQGVVWESEGSIHYCEFCRTQGLCIWVLEEEDPVGSDPNNNPSTRGNYTWRKIYSVANTTLSSILAQAIRPVPVTDHGSQISIKMVYGFNEHLQILLLKTTEGSLVWYDISAKTVSPVSAPFGSPEDALHIKHFSFTYNNMELQDIDGPADKPEHFATGGTSRKTKRCRA